MTTLQKACTAKQFEAEPRRLPRGVDDRPRDVHTPLLPVPLEGPAIFVSPRRRSVPVPEMVLQGVWHHDRPRRHDLHQQAGITSTTFKTVPDAPVQSFEMTLPEGKYSALANGNLCSLTKTVTVKKKVAVRVHGRKKTITRGSSRPSP